MFYFYKLYRNEFALVRATFPKLNVWPKKLLLYLLFPILIILYRRNLKFFFKQILSRDDLVFDIGANTGMASKILSDIGCFVVAFEPEDKDFAFLERRFSKNNKVKTVKKGLAKTKGKRKLYISQDSLTSTVSKYWKSNVLSFEKYEDTQTINVITLNDAIKTYGQPKLIILDTEGYTYNILSRLVSTPKYLHIDFSKKDKRQLTLIKKWLSEKGYKKCQYFPHAKLKVSQWIPIKKAFDKIKKDKDDNLWGELLLKK